MIVKNVFFLCFAFLALSQASAKSTIVPFIFEQGLIIVDAQINNKYGKYIFDTGADAIIVDKKYLDGGSVKFSSANKDFIATKTLLTQVRLGDISLRAVDGYLKDLNHLKSFLKIELSGILGAKIVAPDYYYIDFVNREIIIYDDAPHSLNKGYDRSIPFKVENDVIIITTTIGDKLHNFLLDSGATNNYLHQELGTSNGFSPTGQFKSIVTSDSKTNLSEVYLVHEMQIGPTSITDLSFLSIDLSSINQEFSEPLSGILSFLALGSKQILVDQKHKVLYY